MNRCIGVALVVLILVLPGCTTFSSVRPAAITPGDRLATELSVASPPGDLASWFWGFDCAESCEHVMPALDVALLHAFDTKSERKIEVGLGYDLPLAPYVEGYVQMRGGARPYGFGARIGIPATGWTEHRVYFRADVPHGNNIIIVNPTLFVHTGASPNHEDRGTVLALVQSFGFPSDAPTVMTIPSLSVGVTHAWRTRYREHLQGTGVFASVAVSLVFHRVEAK